MAEKTGIAWADHTSNIAIGCTKVGDGCTNCYAEQLDRARFSKTLTPAVIHWGAGAPRHFRLEAWTKDVQKWNRKAHADNVRRRVFIDSLSDIFDNEWPTEIRYEAFAVMLKCTALDFLLVTKRIGNAEDMLPGGWYCHGAPWDARCLGPYPNLWIGATVVNQEEADRDVPKLLKVPASVRFLSIEPQLGPIDLRRYLTPMVWENGRPIAGRDFGHGRRVDWVICGGESGTKARPFNVRWAREIRDQCAAARVPFFMKQLGSRPMRPVQAGEVAGDPVPKHELDIWLKDVYLKDRAGADPSEWPEDLRVQQFPCINQVRDSKEA